MGITGLLPFLKKASRPSNIKDFAGCTVAIDSYCWLHKGAFSCADKLGTGQETTQYVYYCMKYVNHLLSCGIKPIMVLDGCRLPSKQGVEKSRQERREVNRKKAKQLLREGRNAEAKEYLQRSIDITPKMALELMKACRGKGVDCIVAPYEADAQLAYLNKVGIAQVVITEDSDLVLFGCERIMFKMDFAGNGLLVERTKLASAMDLRPDLYSFDKFRYMCILAGCDYLPSLPGIGLGKACKLFKITRQADVKMMLRKLPVTLKMSNLTVNDDYIEGFIKANNTFLYQLVYDPMQRKLKPLNPYPPEIVPEELGYAGIPFPAEKAFQIALGNIDIYTGEKIAHFNPDTENVKSNSWDRSKPHQLSIWDKDYKPEKFSGPSQKALHPKDVPSTRGKEVTVKVNFPKSAQPAPPAENAVSDLDLVEMYNDLENVEPAAKRTKFQNEEQHVKSPKKIQNSKQLFDELEMEPVNIVIHESVTPARSPLKSPNYENAKTDALSSPEHIPAPEISPKVKKTTKNIFAKNLSGKKEKFQINECKVTGKESRFFKQSQPLRKSAFGEALGHELEGKAALIEDEEDEEKKEHPVIERMESAVLNPRKSSDAGAQKPVARLSLQQAFGFKKLDTSTRLLNGNSPRTSSPFIPVMSRQNSNTSLCSLSQNSLTESQQSDVSDPMNDLSYSSQLEGSFLELTPSQTCSPSTNVLKLKQKPGNLKRKCMDIASMFKRVPKKTFQYSADNNNRTAEQSSTPDLPSLPDGVDVTD